MSNNKVEPKCTLPDQELIERCNEWVHSLAKSGGQSWVLQVPVNFNRDPDMLFIELGKRFETLKAENSKMRNALEEIREIRMIDYSVYMKVQDIIRKTIK